MTPTTPTPNLAQDLIRIHRVITRGLTVGIAKGTEYLQSGFPQPQVFLGYSNYAHSLASVLGAHHQGEDQVAFPVLRIQLPFAPYERLSADHHEIELLLDLIHQAILDLSGNAPKDGVKILVDCLRRVYTIWVPHIQLEEHHFSRETIGEIMSLENQRQLSEAMGKHSQEHAGPPYWVIPFVLFNLGPEDRAAMAATFPPMIMGELVLKVWKDQWAPMKSFLLD